MSPGGGVEGVGADLDVGAEDDRDDVQELAVRRLLRQPANETENDDWIVLHQTRLTDVSCKKKERNSRTRDGRDSFHAPLTVNFAVRYNSAIRRKKRGGRNN